MTIPAQEFLETSGGNLYPDPGTQYNQSKTFQTIAENRDRLDAELREQIGTADSAATIENVRHTLLETTVIPLDFTASRKSGPARTELTRKGRTVAVLTDGCRTGVFYGPNRTFENPDDGPRKISTTAYVHVLPAPYENGDEEHRDIAQLIHAPHAQPDAFEIAVQYGTNQPRRVNNDGLIVAGENGYGKEGEEEGTLLIGSDFHDYLGIEWETPEGTIREPDPDEYRCLDCSGFVRMVYGYRLGFPIGLKEDDGTIPRVSRVQAAQGPGIVLAGNNANYVTPPPSLLPGDVIFFDATSGGNRIHHVGIYMGVDDQNYKRFIHSAPGPDGTTFNNWNSHVTGNNMTTRLEGSGYYAKAIVTIRRF